MFKSDPNAVHRLDSIRSAADFHKRGSGAMAPRRVKQERPAKRGTFPHGVETGWPRAAATIKMQLQVFALLRRPMASLDQVSIVILLGAALVMAGILSSL